jgi:hypothetical protein
MQLITWLRELWRLRVLVIAVGLVSLAVGLGVAFHLPSLERRQHTVWTASARILVDTPRSQVVEVAPKGSDTLGLRANLISNLMADGVVKAAIARRAGIAPRALTAVAESATAPSTDSPTAGAKAHQLTTTAETTPEGDRLPIIDARAQAPDARGAAKLAEAAVTGLRDYLASKAAEERVRDADRLSVSGVGMTQAAPSIDGPGLSLAAAAAIFVFGAGCCGIVLVTALTRIWRLASALEGGEDAEAATRPERDDHERGSAAPIDAAAVLEGRSARRAGAARR